MNGLLNASANLVAIIHIGYFLFVLGGAVAIVSRARRHGDLVRNAWFRTAHAAAVFIVLAEDVAGIPCPLNTVQAWLRTEAIQQEHATNGVGGLLDFLLYGLISPLTLQIFYWAMGLIVIVLFWIVPVRWRTAALARD